MKDRVIKLKITVVKILGSVFLFIQKIIASMSWL